MKRRKGMYTRIPFRGSTMPSTRPTLYGSRHAVSAGHYLAAAAGFAILEAGGNAIDAGCAAGIALAVLHPDEVNVAGVAPIMIRTGPQEGAGKVVTIAGLGHWPKRLPGRSLHARAWRQDAVGHPAHRGAGRTRRLDHRAHRLRHDVVRRCRGCRRALRARGLRGVRVHGDHDQAVRGRLSLLAVQCRDLPARRQAAPGRRPLRADRSRRHAAVHDRPGARGVQARPAGRPRRGARRLLLRRHRRDDRALSRSKRRLPRRATTSPTSTAATRSRCGCAGATSRSSPAVRGARARCWPRRCA